MPRNTSPLPPLPTKESLGAISHLLEQGFIKKSGVFPPSSLLSVVVVVVVVVGGGGGGGGGGKGVQVPLVVWGSRKVTIHEPVEPIDKNGIGLFAKKFLLIC